MDSISLTLIVKGKTGLFFAGMIKDLSPLNVPNYLFTWYYYNVKSDIIHQNLDKKVIFPETNKKLLLQSPAKEFSQ